MAWDLFIKMGGITDPVASGEFTDDAELLFNDYKRRGISCKVVSHGLFYNDEVAFEYEPEVPNGSTS